MPPKDELGAWLDNAVHAIWKFSQDNKLDAPVIVGHSMGGHLALRMAIEHPGAFSRIVSIDGAPVTPIGGLDMTSATAEERQAAARQVAALSQAFGQRQWNAHQRLRAGSEVKDPVIAERLAEMFISVPPPITIQYMADFISTDLRPQLMKITDPTLVIASLPTGDLEEGAEAGARAAWTALVKQSENLKLVFFDHSRHFIQFDRPAELDATIADFLAGREVNDVMTPDHVDEPTTAPAESRH
jgi:pimeloyl-ACP methyl ester carboxylesterase